MSGVRPIFAVLLVTLACTLVALALTGVLMVQERSNCADEGGSWSLDWPSATSTCSWGAGR